MPIYKFEDFMAFNKDAKYVGEIFLLNEDRIRYFEPVFRTFVAAPTIKRVQRAIRRRESVNIQLSFLEDIFRHIDAHYEINNINELAYLSYIAGSVSENMALDFEQTMMLNPNLY